MSDAAQEGAVLITNLRERPDALDQVALWHHRECLQQGLASELPQRLKKLNDHITNGHPIPQTWLALSAGQVCGCVSIVSYHLRKSDQDRVTEEPLWLSNLYVAPEYRGHGVGAQLVRFAEDIARQLGRNELWLIARERTQYYLALGWQEVRQAKIAKQSVNVMRRPL